MSEKLLEIKDEKLSFFTPAGEVKALNGVSFSMNEGEVLGIVGESGSGKSVTAYSIMGTLALLDLLHEYIALKDLLENASH